MYSFPSESTIDSIDIILLSTKFNIKNLWISPTSKFDVFLSAEIIKKIASAHNLIVTVEEHSIIGGLGSAVSEFLSTLNQKPPLLSIGLPDEYGEAGSYKKLLEKRSLFPNQIANSILNRFYSI